MSITKTVRYLNIDPDWSRILEYIRTEGPITTRDVARATDLDYHKVSTIVRSMRFDGFVVRVSTSPTGAGLWKAKGQWGCKD